MRILIIFLFILLAGCSSSPKAPAPMPVSKPTEATTTSWQNHQNQLARLQHWQAEGRLAVSQGSKGSNASFVWQQKGDAYLIKLFGPFGSGSVYITGSAQKVQLKEANGKITTAQSPELLLKQVAGWQVPLSGLRYWLRGLPVPDENLNAQQFNAQGQMRSLQQQGWKIDYENYLAENAVPLPSKLRLQRNDLKIKMIVTSWKQI